MPQVPQARSILAALAVYADPRVLTVFVLGFASGLPLALTGTTLSAWLTDQGLSLTAIGLFAAVGTPYTIKFLWAPLIDRAPLPLLTATLGRRRAWLLASQAALVAAILALGALDPRTQLQWVALLAVAVAAASATQDIVIDAWRVELLPQEQQGAGAAAAVFGYRVGMLASGAGALYVASFWSWDAVYPAMAALLLVGVGMALFGPAPRAVGDRLQGQALGAWVRDAVLGPFVEFFRRSGWAVVLGFALLFKFGDALAGAMATPFYLKLGFTKVEIANVAKLYGFAATLIGLFIGGWLMNAVGLLRALWICGGLQLLSNLMFAVLAGAGADLGLLAVTVGFENLSGGMGTAALVAYLSSLCNVSYTATQYALLSAFTAFARTWFSTPAGWLAERLDWAPFFVLTAAAAVPGLVLLYFLTATVARSASAPASTPGPATPA